MKLNTKLPTSQIARALALGCAVLLAATQMARAADPAPAPAAPNYNQSAISTGVNACSTQLSNCQSVCSQADPKCVRACDATYNSCAASSGDTAKK